MSNVSFFSVSTQFENVGDALINRELISLVAKFSNVYVDVSRCPEHFVDSLDLDFENVRIVNKYYILIFYIFLSIVRRCKVFYFLNPGGLGIKLSLREAMKSLIYSTILILLRGVGVRVVHTGMSYDPMDLVDRLVIRYRYLSCAHIFPRDHRSYEYLRSIGIRVDGVVPDLAFLLPQKINEHRDDGVIVSFRTDGIYESSKKDIYRLISDLRSNGVTRFLFVSQVERDFNFMDELYQHFRKGLDDAVFLDVSRSIDGALENYGGYGCCYSNRLHVLLMSASRGAIPIACISDGQGGKIASMFADLNLSENISDFNAACNAQALDYFACGGKNITRALGAIFDR